MSCFLRFKRAGELNIVRGSFSQMFWYWLKFLLRDQRLLSFWPDYRRQRGPIPYFSHFNFWRLAQSCTRDCLKLCFRVFRYPLSTLVQHHCNTILLMLHSQLLSQLPNILPSDALIPLCGLNKCNFQFDGVSCWSFPFGPSSATLTLHQGYINERFQVLVRKSPVLIMKFYWWGVIIWFRA